MKTCLTLPTSPHDRSRNASEVMTAMMRMMASQPPLLLTEPRKSAERSRARLTPYRHLPSTRACSPRTRTDPSLSRDTASPDPQLSSGTDSFRSIRGDLIASRPPSLTRIIAHNEISVYLPHSEHAMLFRKCSFHSPLSSPLLWSAWIGSIQICHGDISNCRRLI